MPSDTSTNTTPEPLQPNDIQLTKNDISEAALVALETKHDKIRSILSRRHYYLRELFVLLGMKEEDEEDTLGSDGAWKAFWEKVDLQELDENKLKLFLERHKLGGNYLYADDTTMEDSSSAGQSPESKSMDKKLARRVLPPPARMVTRGVSGAVRPKSVDEILSSLDQKDVGALSSKEPKSNHHSPTPPLLKQRTQQIHITQKKPDWKIGQPQMYNGVKVGDIGGDRIQTLDLFAWQVKAKAQPLHKALQTAKKTITTQDWKLAREEMKAIKIIQRIEDLKAKNMWGFRQLKRHRASPRSKTHWDSLLDEMKWMQTDYKEERKWKKAMAFMISRAVMEWHWVEDKSTVCVKSKIPSPLASPLHGPQVTNMDVDGNLLDTTEKEDDDLKAMDMEPVTPLDPTFDSTTIFKTPPTSEHLSPSTVDDASSKTPSSPSLSAATIQQYRSLIRDLNPDIPLITLPVQEFGDLDAHALFPDLLLYEPPNPNYDDPYFDEIEFSRIVPFSALMSRKIELVSRSHVTQSKRTIDGEPIVSPYDPKVKKIKTLPQHNRFDTTPLISPLFAPKKIKDTPALQPSTPPVSHTHAPNTWSEDDDVCLIKLILQYSFNWDLICDTLNADRLPISGLRRTPWECHERWRLSNLTSLSGQINSIYVPKMKKEFTRRPALVRLDSTSKRHRQYNIFEAIKRTQKKREEAQKPTNTTVPPRSTVETHGFSSSGQRLPTAMDLTMLKFQRDRQMAQALMEQRQLSASYGLPVHSANAIPPAAAAQAQAQAAAAQAQAQAQQAQSQVSSPAVHAIQNRQPMVSSPVSGVPQQSIPAMQNNINAAMNRYPPAQLQLLRQQQMVLMAAAQAQAQQQLQSQQAAAAAAGQQGQSLPSGSTPIQRTATPPIGVQPQVHTPAPSAETVAQQVSQMTSPVVNQQTASPRVPAPNEQQQVQQPMTAQQLQNTSLALMAAQLMGLPLAQMNPQQQLQLQRYIAQLQLRSSMAQQMQNVNAGSPLAGSPTMPTTSTSTPSPQQQQQQQIPANQAAALQQQQLQRLQQMAQIQQVLQQQQALQQMQQMQQLQQQQLQQQRQQSSPVPPQHSLPQSSSPQQLPQASVLPQQQMTQASSSPIPPQQQSSPVPQQQQHQPQQPSLPNQTPSQ
ncbi:uncharacterized protein BX664DRAFT_315017 [Halteromyces radiatus]|uniref:uncharacterized protein n=1 Tax=Halteromyces radiatus TaxID=101107 RepID=UPI00221FA4C9|nr:uncharacterized protein BX664DRAFT_315017 [Halteromyces radiatus]KAI8089856.1 hypothetical protein BX664DRAFT_315017 [Halteromyces radiatus]